MLIKITYFLTWLVISSADSIGSVLYPAATNEAMAYSRVIQLQYAGSDNGKLLATFENWYAKSLSNSESNGTAAPFVIRESSDDGATWSTVTELYDPQQGEGHPYQYSWQPFFFEFPKTLGNYPTGTILLVGNIVPADGSSTNFFSWRSSDHGKTWSALNVWQTGGAGGNGIWEPFLYLNSQQQLVAVFSDERNSSEHSQMLVHVVSDDGGDTWGPVIRDIASPVQRDRPGMPSVALMDNGKYAMSYEFCGQPNCFVRYKFSDDGTNWNATDIGTAIQSKDGLTGGASPYIIWLEETKSLILSTRFIYTSVNDQQSAQWYRSVFVNTNHGEGLWDWAPSPWAVSDASPVCKANYSPNLVSFGEKGLVLYSAPTSVDNTGYCSENTGFAPIGYLPYSSNFSSNSQAGWINLGGNWSIDGDVYKVITDDNTDLALVGSTAWSNYHASVQIRLDASTTQAGLSIRITSPTVGRNTFKGYTAFVSVSDDTLKLARNDYSTGYDQLSTVSVTNGVQQNTWYQLDFEVTGYNFTATLQPVGGNVEATISAQESTYSRGLVGLWASNGDASYQNVEITAI